MIARREQLARFYLAEHARLQRIVAREVPAHAVEDACHTAWTVLLRRPDIPLDGRGVAWLRTVALTTGRRTAIRPPPPSSPTRSRRQGLARHVARGRPRLNPLPRRPP